MASDEWAEPDEAYGFMAPLLLSPTIVVCIVAIAAAIAHLAWSLQREREGWWKVPLAQSELPSPAERERVVDLILKLSALGMVAPGFYYLAFPPLLLGAVGVYACGSRVSSRARPTDRVPRGVPLLVLVVTPGVVGSVWASIAAPPLAPVLLLAAAGIAVLPWQLAAVRRAELTEGPSWFQEVTNVT